MPPDGGFSVFASMLLPCDADDRIRLAEQESGETMIRASMLRNYPVVLLNKKIGLVQSISVDWAQKRVCALMISCGLRGRRMVLREHILAFADGFILTDETRRFSAACEEKGARFIRDTAGMLLGRVSDYAVDEATLEICAVEMISGYLPFGLRRRIWIYDYASPQELRSEITVPAVLSCEPNCFLGGNG